MNICIPCCCDLTSLTHSRQAVPVLDSYSASVLWCLGITYFHLSQNEFWMVSRDFKNIDPVSTSLDACLDLYMMPYTQYTIVTVRNKLFFITILSVISTALYITVQGNQHFTFVINVGLHPCINYPIRI